TLLRHELAYLKDNGAVFLARLGLSFNSCSVLSLRKIEFNCLESTTPDRAAISIASETAGLLLQ
ncbi:MAG TPA: hypothetical protein VFD75_05875, partial [Pyrinomonadaceae bacterium]|nr:hypothetical protein [Pyrinomonadaceae bacterium]